jgi:hypothetical protein
LFDTRDVPHGAVAAVTYKSTALNRFRRLHVYTPPGFEAGKDRYPVFYLLHGAGDNDEAWSSVGARGNHLGQSHCCKKARPMVIVMPAGYTSSTTNNSIGRTATEEFVSDFVNDVMPYVEKHYRRTPAALVLDRKRGSPDRHDSRDGGTLQEARFLTGVQRVARRSHVAKLAQLPSRVRSTALPDGTDRHTDDPNDGALN